MRSGPGSALSSKTLKLSDPPVVPSLQLQEYVQGPSLVGHKTELPHIAVLAAVAVAIIEAEERVCLPRGRGKASAEFDDVEIEFIRIAIRVSDTSFEDVVFSDRGGRWGRWGRWGDNNIVIPHSSTTVAHLR